jgi:hypothetical protein
MRIVHLTARLRKPLCGRIERRYAAWLWTHLRRAFPQALAVMFMPNHVHLLVVVDAADRAHERFLKVLAAFARQVPWPRPVWEPIPPAQCVGDPEHVNRSVRYIALNPARRKLVDDPLAWYWSSYRDVVGATADPWITFERLRRFLPREMRTVEALHAFVSADSRTRVEGTPPPYAARDVVVATRPLGEILRAATLATRASTKHHQRRGPTRDTFVWLASTQGWNDTALLAEVCAAAPSTITRILREPIPKGLDAARLCLGDDRLLFGPDYAKRVRPRVASSPVERSFGDMWSRDVDAVIVRPASRAVGR